MLTGAATFKQTAADFYTCPATCKKSGVFFTLTPLAGHTAGILSNHLILFLAALRF